MSMTSLLGSAAASMAGTIQKGIIEVIDMRVPTAEQTQQAQQEGPVGAGGLPGSSSTPVGGSIMSTEGPGLLLSGPLFGIVANAARTNPTLSRKWFTVQFNPGEIRISGYGGGLYTKMEFSQSAQDRSQLDFAEMNPRVTLDLNLIFDETDPQEAFMTEPFSLAPSSVVKTVAKAAQKAVKPTVQEKAEAFTAVLRNEHTRYITFHWGDINYSGTLIRVSVRYTMFDMAGVPTRATVGLSIVCIDDTDELRDTAEWDEYYKEAFSSSGSLGGKATVMNSKLGNILNVNL